MTSANLPKGDRSQWPTTTRVPLLLPTPAICPWKREREGGMRPFWPDRRT